MSRDLEPERPPHERPNFMKILKIMKILIFEAFQPDLKRISRGAVPLPRNVQVTRRAYKLLAVLIKSNSEAEVS